MLRRTRLILPCADDTEIYDGIFLCPAITLITLPPKPELHTPDN